MFEAMQSRREWPPAARSGLDDALFTDGWGTAADRILAGELTTESLLAGLSAEERGTAEELVASHASDLEVIATANGAAAPKQPEIPDIISATSWVRLQKGDLSAWDILRPIPSRPTSARRLGTEVHRMIEEKSRGISAFPEEEELDEPEQVFSDPGVIQRLMEEWANQGYGERKVATLPSGEPMIELPFTFKKDGRVIRGRIDAVYETDDGGLEIVDFKTGQRFEAKPGEADQLELYAEALQALGLAPIDNIKLTYAFLSAGS